jgi:hypothetical protein
MRTPILPACLLQTNLAPACRWGLCFSANSAARPCGKTENVPEIQCASGRNRTSRYSFSRCGCVRRGAATDANARRTASRQIALASFVDNTLQTIQWFSHGIFVLRPHFLRHQVVWLLHVPRMGSQLGETRPRHTLSSGPLFFSDGQKEITGKLFEPPGDSPQSLKVCFDLTSTSVVHV